VLALHAQQKYALVIGNGAYTTVTRLNNPVNDANDMAEVLRSLGFQVDLLLNSRLDQMEDAAIRLKNRLSVNANAYGFFFYAGHGVQSSGDNYLIPVDADIKSESFLRTKALHMQAVLDELNQAGNALNVVVLDACRDNPFSWGRGGNRGLNVVNVQPADSIIVFATSAGKAAADGMGRNSPFTTELLKNLKTPGIEVNEMLRRTGADVSKATNREQIPAIYSQFFETAYLGRAGVQPDPSPQPPERPVPEGFVRIPAVAPPENLVPDGFMRILSGTFMMGSPAGEVGRDSDETQHQVWVSEFYMSRHEVTVGEFRSFVNATGYRTTAETSGGGYVYDRNEGWVMKGDANWKNPYFSQGDRHPVVLVSWFDAVQYCNWRSVREGLAVAYTVNGDSVTWNRNANGYRLPTEAEWEYACRAGTATPFSTGNNITTNQANYDENYPYNGNAKGVYREKTWDVGSGTPNVWGLYDMHGNVWEWCWDWFGDYSSASQTDPVGPAAGSYRVGRGGSWLGDAQTLRSARRGDGEPGSRSHYLGFRPVRP
jgi:formylglycine-generating enzyme required for sulfatase activity